MCTQVVCTCVCEALVRSGVVDEGTEAFDTRAGGPSHSPYGHVTGCYINILLGPT